MSTSAKNLTATESSASSGQGWNQSITVHVTRAGNFLARPLRDSPTGEKQRAICRFLLTLPMKKFQQLSFESTIPSLLTAGLTLLTIPSTSSAAKRSAISPDESKSLRYTRNLSLVIYPSVKRNISPSSLTPAFMYMFWRSVLRSFMP